jgi:stearoyl-CoA desaturase (delta-9 desaturase)
MPLLGRLASAIVRLSDVNWTTSIFIVGYHVALFVGLPFYLVYQPPSALLIAVSLVLLVSTEIGIGAAYHRFYAHRCYRLSRPAEAVLLFLATLATQGSALQWAHDHRMHHSFTDTEQDPYSIKRGFWHAHVLWLFKKSWVIEDKRVPDLLQNRLVIFQHRWAGTLSMATNLVVCVAVGWLVSDFLGAFVLAWWTRLALGHHLTWSINSLAHCWGARTFSREQTAVDNYLLALVTVGEGYHNYHHTFPSDYRNGVRWYHVDPTKWTIWTLSKLGLAHGLKRVSAARIEQRLLSEDRRLLADRLRDVVHSKKADLERRIESLFEAIQQKIGRKGALAEQLRRLRLARRDREAARAARQARRELREVRRSLRRDLKAWNGLCGRLLESRAV